MDDQAMTLGVAVGAMEARPRDWPEDFAHENGMYINACCLCTALFVGHKRRPACRTCPGDTGQEGVGA